jgi:hypothetical protein
MMNKTVVLLLVTTVGLGAVAMHLVLELHAEREQVQTLQARIDELARNELPRDPAPPRSSPFQPPEPTVAEVPARGAIRAIAKTNAAVTGAGVDMPSREEHMRMIREGMERQRALFADPEYSEAMQTQQKLMLARTYPDLAQELQISSEQADRLLTLLAEQQLRHMQQQSSPALADEPPKLAELADMQRKWQQQQQADEAELASLLGDDMLNAWKEYQSTLDAGHQVEELRSVLASRGIPLPDGQTKPLLKAFADQQRSAQEWITESQSGQVAGDVTGPGFRVTNLQEQADWQERQLERTARDHERLRDAVAPFLTREQLEVFTENQNAQLKMQQMQIRMMRAQAAAEN